MSNNYSVMRLIFPLYSWLQLTWYRVWNDIKMWVFFKKTRIRNWGFSALIVSKIVIEFEFSTARYPTTAHPSLWGFSEIWKTNNFTPCLIHFFITHCFIIIKSAASLHALGTSLQDFSLHYPRPLWVHSVTVSSLILWHTSVNPFGY